MDTRFLSDSIQVLLHFLLRGAVQRQIIAIFLALLVAWLLSRIAWNVVGRIRQTRGRQATAGGCGLTTEKRDFLDVGLMILRFEAYPIISVLLLETIQVGFSQRQWLSGVIEDFIVVFTVFVVYRFFIVFLHLIFCPETARRVRRRVLAPLFAIFAVGYLLYTPMELNTVMETPLFMISGSPITLRAILLSTVGLYLWFEGTWNLQSMAQELVNTRMKSAHPGKTEAAFTLVRYVLIAFGIFFVLNSLRFDSTTIAAISGGLSVGIGFGMTNVVNNFVSGLLILFEGSLRPGDVLEIDGERAVLKKMNIRSAVLLTKQNVQVVVPNQTFLSSKVKNFTSSHNIVWDSFSLTTPDPAKVQLITDILLSAARQQPDIIKDAPGLDPHVYVSDLSLAPQKVVRHELWFAMDVHKSFLLFQVSSDLRTAISRMLVEENIF